MRNQYGRPPSIVAAAHPHSPTSQVAEVEWVEAEYTGVERSVLQNSLGYLQLKGVIFVGKATILGGKLSRHHGIGEGQRQGISPVG